MAYDNHILLYTPCIQHVLTVEIEVTRYLLPPTAPLLPFHSWLSYVYYPFIHYLLAEDAGMLLAGWFCTFVAWHDPVGGVGWIEMSQKESIGVARCVI